jgi:hypothetical protein
MDDKDRRAAGRCRRRVDGAFFCAEVAVNGRSFPDPRRIVTP